MVRTEKELLKLKIVPTTNVPALYLTLYLTYSTVVDLIFTRV